MLSAAISHIDADARSGKCNRTMLPKQSSPASRSPRYAERQHHISGLQRQTTHSKTENRFCPEQQHSIAHMTLQITRFELG